MRLIFPLLFLTLSLGACTLLEIVPPPDAEGTRVTTTSSQEASSAMTEEITPSPTVASPLISPTTPLLEEATRPTQAPPPAEPSPAAPSDLTTPETIVDELVGNNPPPRDDVRLAVAYLGANSVLPTAEPPVDMETGTFESFYIGNVDSNTVSTIEAELVSIGDNAYFWFDRGPGSIDPDVEELARVTDSFDQIYETLYAYFGVSEPAGGRVHIIHASPEVLCDDPDQCGLAGYFSSRDLLPQSINPQSNERPMFVMNTQQFGTGNYLDVLAHELRHMLGNGYDASEEDWFVEGGAMLAEELAGYELIPQVRGSLFLQNPDQQLNRWTDSNTIPYYGQGYLLNRYIYDRLGAALYRDFIFSSEPGLVAIDAIARENNLDLTGDGLWLDWLVAMALHDEENAPTEFQWAGPPLDQVSTTPVNNLPGTFETTVHQYAADYYELPSSGEVTIEFAGRPSVQLLSQEPISGDHYWYAQRANDSNPRLTRAVDLRDVNRATLAYDVFVDIEQGYDFAYVAVSVDDGQTWAPLEADGMQGLLPEDDPSNRALASRFYTGQAGSWISESADLSKYAGQEILLRFEYVTDPILTYGGFALDNIAIGEIDFFDDAETFDLGWNAEGFTRANGLLPQRWPLQLVTFDSDGRPTVERLDVDEDGRMNYAFQALPGTRRPLLIVAAIAPETLELAHYSLVIR